MPASIMRSTVEALLAPGKGLLAADESLKTIGKRFEALGIACTEESRRNYRAMLITTPTLPEHISGVILYDETLRQKVGDALIPDVLSRSGVIPGIKVDKGTVALPSLPGEKVTEGLDGLRERLAEYWRLGARFTKWRAVIAVSAQLPSRACIDANTQALARFAALCQEASLVPIIEPEVLMDGNHTLQRCEEVTTRVLSNLFDHLSEYQVSLEKMILKTGMVLPGRDSPDTAPDWEVAEGTLRCLRRSVPSAVPGIVFLSGGQSSVAATARLNAICAMGRAPWTLSFSFGRALQNDAMAAWRGLAANVPAAQDALRHRTECNGLAVQGKYSSQIERASPLD